MFIVNCRNYPVLIVKLIIRKMSVRRACTNCKSVITCGCQVKTSSDGKQVCTRCLTQYENNLKAQCQPIVQTVITAK